MPHRALAGLLAAAVLAACSQFPELDDSFGASGRDADFPDLVPVESLRADLPGQRIGDDASDALEARVGRLRARAAGLRGTVIDRNARARLSQDVILPEAE